MPTHPTVLAGLTLALVTGCQMAGEPGGMSGEPDDMPGPDAPAAQSLEATIGYLCDFIEACPAMDPNSKAIQLYVHAGGDCPSGLAGRLIADATVDLGGPLDPLAAEACFARSIADCLPIDALPGCGEVWASARQVGEPCAAGARCGEGLYCAYDPNVEEGLCGESCAPQLPPGEVCQSDAACADDGERVGDCRDAGEFRRCVTVRWRVAQVGQPCGEIDGPDGLDRVGCGRDAICWPGPDGATCAALSGAGAECMSSAQCGDDLICLDGACAPADVRNVPGGVCGDDPEEGEACNALFGLQCIGGTCVATDGEVDAPCDPVRGSRHCQAGNYCSAEGTCQPQRLGGEACEGPDADRQCHRGRCVEDPATGVGTCQADPRAICDGSL